MNVNIDPFDISLYDEVLALWERCEGVGLSDADAREAIDTYLKRNPGMSFVARAGKDVVGAILAGHDGRRGYIYHLAVDNRWRRQGIARLLVEKALQALKSAAIRKTHIFIFTDNKSGLTFWQSVGWTYRNDIRVVSKNI